MSRAHFLRRVLPCAACLAMAAPRSVLAGGGQHPFSGLYRFAGGPQQSRALDAAIDEVVGQLSYVIRGVARRRLRQGVRPWSIVELDFGHGRAVQRAPGFPRLAGPDDGRPFRWTNQEGASVQVRLELIGRRFSARYTGDGADSRFTYRFRPDGEAFELQATVDHIRMPEPLRYRLSYARQR